MLNLSRRIIIGEWEALLNTCSEHKIAIDISDLQNLVGIVFLVPVKALFERLAMEYEEYTNELFRASGITNSPSVLPMGDLCYLSFAEGINCRHYSHDE